MVTGYYDLPCRTFYFIVLLITIWQFLRELPYRSVCEFMHTSLGHMLKPNPLGNPSSCFEGGSGKSKWISETNALASLETIQYEAPQCCSSQGEEQHHFSTPLWFIFQTIPCSDSYSWIYFLERFEFFINILLTIDNNVWLSFSKCNLNW